MQPGVMKLFEERLNEIINPLITMMTAYYKKKGSKNPTAEAFLAGALMDGIGFNYVFNSEHYPIDEVKKIIIERFV